MRTLRDIPGYDAAATHFIAHDGRPVTYSMSYTAGLCTIRHTGEVRGYHCWHRGIDTTDNDTQSEAFCCGCTATRPALPDEPSH